MRALIDPASPSSWTAAIASLRTPVVQRHRQARADGERVFARDTSLAERGKRGGDVALDAQLDELGAENGEQSPRCVEGDDPAGLDDRDAVAESLRLIEVVRRQQDRQLAPAAQAGDHVQQLGADARIESDRWLVQEQHARV